MIYFNQIGYCVEPLEFVECDMLGLLIFYDNIMLEPRVTDNWQDQLSGVVYALTQQEHTTIFATQQYFGLFPVYFGKVKS